MLSLPTKLALETRQKELAGTGSFPALGFRRRWRPPFPDVCVSQRRRSAHDRSRRRAYVPRDRNVVYITCRSSASGSRRCGACTTKRALGRPLIARASRVEPDRQGRCETLAAVAFPDPNVPWIRSSGATAAILCKEPSH